MTITSGPSRLPNGHHRFRTDDALSKNAAGGNESGLESFRPMLFYVELEPIRTLPKVKVW
jgi:hypothetical protein